MRPKSPTSPRQAGSSALSRAGAVLAMALSASALSGCVTTTTSQPAGVDRAVLTAIPVSRAWVVWEDDRIVGSVVRYSEPGSDGRFLYVVRNLWDQDMGVIDERGRAWKGIPHEEDRWLSTGTIVQGVGQILETGKKCRLVELGTDEVEAATAAARAH